MNKNHKSLILKWFFSFILLTGLVLGYQNCGEPLPEDEANDYASTDSPDSSNSPEITQDLESTGQAQVGGDYFMVIQARGEGLLTYQWFHNKIPIPAANQNILILRSVQLSHAGHYQAVVTGEDSFSTNSAVLTLTVSEPPPQSPPPQSPPVCAPLFGTVAQRMSGLGYRYSGSCGKSCVPSFYSGCPEASDGYWHCSGPSSANPVPYAVRDLNTLNCVTRTANFYSSRQCRANYSGNPCK